MDANQFIKLARKNIHSDVSKRISPQVQEALNSKNYVFDGHVHIFDKTCVNETYFLLREIPSRLRSLFFPASESSLLLHLGKSKKRMLKFAEKERLETIEDIYKMTKQGSPLPDWNEIEAIYNPKLGMEQKNILGDHFFTHHANSSFINFLIDVFFPSTKMEAVLNHFMINSALTQLGRFKDKKLISAVLMMDFYNVWGTKVTKTLWDQIDEFSTLSDKYPILPFFPIDPRRVDDSDSRENLFNLFLKAFDKTNGCFFGVKFYPALGFSPSDYRLAPIYEICQEFQIPIVTHCGGEVVSSYEEKILIYNNFDKNDVQVVPGKTRIQRAFYLNDPERWTPVLQRYPKLRINLAHFGGNDAWTESAPSQSNKRIDTMMDLMESYKGVYTDFAFNIIKPDTFEKFKKQIKENEIIKSKTMHGTDYWVCLPSGDLLKEQQIFFEGLDSINKALTTSMTETNPYRFFFTEF